MSDWRTKKIKSPQRFKDKKHRQRDYRDKGLGKWLGAALALLVLFYVLSYILPRVDIIIIPESRLVEFNDSIIVVLDQTAAENSNSVLLGKNLYSQSNINEIFVATGEKDIGEKSIGIVNFYNFTGLSQPVMIEDGLETNDGKQFTITSPLTIPAATVSPEGEIKPGEIEASVIALEAGEDNNIPPQKLFIMSVPPEKQLKIYGQNNSDFSGGTSEKIQVISEEDLKQAQDKLREALTDKILKQISEDLPENQTFMRDTFRLVDEDFTSKFSLNQETEEFNYELSAKGEVLVYNNKDLEKLIKDKLSPKLLPGEVFLSEIPSSFDITSISQNSPSGTNLQIKALWPVSQPVDTVQFLEEILGQREADARRIILQNEAVSDVRFDWSFAINRRIPNIPSHINIRLGTQ